MRASKYQLKRLGRKGLSLLMAMTMCLSLIQISVFADDPDPVDTQTDKQISDDWDGGTVSYTGDGTVTTGSNWAVQLSRTLTATGTENLFNVNMEVVTKDEEIEVTNSSAAVTLVLDTSGSMGWCAECGQSEGDHHTFSDTNKDGKCDVKINKHSCGKTAAEHPDHSFTQSRLAAAKTALVSFLNSYAKDEYGNFYSSARMVSLVTFADSATNWDLSSTYGNQYWVNVNNQTALTYVTNIITKSSGSNQITASGGTNTDAGMSAAADLLNTSNYSSAIGSIDNRFCILLTDGKPTYYTYYYYGYPYRGGNGSDTTTEETSHAQQSCEDVTDTGAALYSIAYGLSGDTVPVYGVGNVSVANWLRDYCGSTGVYDANSSQALIDAFNDILTNTSHSGSTTNGVTAAIGDLLGTTSRAYTFIGFNDENGLVLDGGAPAASYNGASVTGDALNWDLDDAVSAPGTIANTTAYTLSYQVRLNNNVRGFQDWTASGHDADAEYSVGAASLNYQYTAPDGSVSSHDADFPVVKSHGYLGAFNFMKIAHHRGVDSNDNSVTIPLAGAPFQLTNSANAPLFVQAGAITQNTTSQAAADNQTLGEVAFTAIPSGYAYTLSETDGFTYNDRPYQKTDDTWNVSVSYGVVSDAPSGNVENTLEQIPQHLTLTKTWNVPSANSTQLITVDLYQDEGQSPVATLTLNGSDTDISTTDPADTNNYQVTYVSGAGATTWVYTITVPQINQETGGEYTYTTQEHSLGNGFTTTYSEDTLSITNTITDQTSVTVKKQWLPINGEEMTSIPPVTVTLYRTSDNISAQQAGEITLPKDGSFTYTWPDLDKYDNYGQPYTYSVSEPDGDYQQVGRVTGTGTSGDPFVLTNTVLEGTTSATVTKTWQGGSDWPGVTVELLQDGQSFGLTDGQTSTTYNLTSDDLDTSVLAGNVWTHTFTGLPEFAFTRDANHVITGVHRYAYSVKELSDWDGYTSVKGGDLNLINTRSQKVSIQVNKEWDHKGFDLEDQEVTFELFQDGQSQGTKTTENGVATFSDLDQFDPANGSAYAYKVLEVGPTALLSSYTTKYDYGNGNHAGPVVFGDNDVGVVDVTNTLIADDETVVITVNKIWQHPQGTTPPSVTFTLTQTGTTTEDVDTVTLEAEDGTSCDFAPQLKYYYEQKEVQTGTDESGVPVFETVVTPHEYTYTVTEAAVAGYTSGDGVDDGNNTWTFTNTITGEVTLNVEKVWQDLSATGRPTATIRLMRSDGTLNASNNLIWEDTGKQLVTNSNQTSGNWTIDKYSPTGKLYTYKVVEDDVSNYTTSYSPANATYTADINKVTVTNTLTQDATYNFTASKTWVDNGNADGTRKPITLTLYQVANGAETALGTVIINTDGTLGTGTYTGGVSVSVDEENPNKWSIQFNNLQKYAYDGNNVYAYSYKVAEAAVDNYDTAIANGKDITNTLRQSTASITIHKNWLDPVGTEHPDVTFTLNATAGGGNVAGFPKTVILGFSASAIIPSADEAGTAAAPAGDDWYYTWENLPKYDDNQRRITYTVSEGTVAGYTAQDNGNFSFTNTIEQEYLDFNGQKVWNMGNVGDGDYLKPDAQPVTIGLYYVNADNTLGQLVKMADLSNPVIVTPDDSTFKFEGLPRYNGSGEENRYVVREVEVTASQSGEPGYTPIDNGGFITLHVTDNSDKTYDYKYAVAYTGDNDTTVTNTYEDPQVYFYQIIGNYYTYLSGGLSSSEKGVNLNENGVPYYTENVSKLISVEETDYTTFGGTLYTYVSGEPSVTLDEVNHMYTIELNYERHLYQLHVNYVFPDGDKPTGDTYKDYTDSKHYLGDETYTGTHRAAPDGFELYKVTVENGSTPVSGIGLDHNGGTFANADVTVTYHYKRDINPTPSVTDPDFTIQKIGTDTQANITHDSAEFQVFTDAECANAVTGKLFSTSTGDGPDAGTVTVKASDLGAGTWYLKEVKAPSGYTAEDTVWKAEVGYSESQVLDQESNRFINKIVWTLSVTELNKETSALDADNILTVPNTREYGWMQITKAVTGLSGAHTFTFTVTGVGEPMEYSITVTGSGNVSMDAVQVPTGTYVVEEKDASISGGYSLNTTYSNEDKTVEVTSETTKQAPANITVTNDYTYSPSNDDISGKKVWDDDNNRDGLRPISVRVQLFQGQEEGPAVRSIGLTPIPDATFDVPVNGDGTFSITYDTNKYPGPITVKEIGYTDSEGYHSEPLPGYEVTAGSQGNEYTVTNTHVPETVYIQAEKVWASGSQQAVTLRLYANGQPLDSVLVLDGTEDTNEYTPWYGEFPGAFPKYEDGKLINYAVTEDSLGSSWSYTTSKEPIVDGDAIYGYQFTVTNSYSSGGGGGDSESYYYRIDYVYTGYGADGGTIYRDAVTGGVQNTGTSSYSFTAADSANHGGYAFSLTSGANLSASLAGTSRSNPYVFTVYYEFTELEDGSTPTGETPDTGTGTTPDQPIDIPDGAVPKAEVPATGDTLPLWIMAAAVSGLGLVWLALTGKKRREDENS